jgi:hypothetical protein
MKKILFSIALIASGLVASAQVGVGTENPQTSLHIVGANATDKGTNGANVPGALAATDGITVPVVTNDMTLAVPGDLVAGTKVSQMVYSTFSGKTGYYYWDGAAWVKVGRVAPSARVTSTNTLTNADLNGYVIYNGAASAQFALSTLTAAKAGDTITLADASANNIAVTGFAVGSGTRTAPLTSAQGSITYVYVVDEVTPANTGWWNVGAM